MSFDQFNIHPKCVQALAAKGITTPTPIQAQAIPVALDGRDVVAIAQTGTGKTLAFALPAMTRLAADRPTGHSGLLVLTPTRELAYQIQTVVEPLGQVLGLRTACVYGGVGMEPQSKALRRGADVIIATPGRLLDHIERGNARFTRIRAVVLDEADRMLDMGFLPDIQRILRELPAERQTMMFSATFPKAIERLTATFQRDPIRIEVAAASTPAEAVRQGIYTVESGRKMELLAKILSDKKVGSTLVFMRTKHRTDRVARALHKQGIKAEAIHGGRSQSQRERALDGFRRGRYQVLVATDVAARGIDVEGITHVVNFDIPKTSDDYIHRIGRTARANADGDAITFVSPNEFMELGAIEKSLGRNLPRTEWEGAVNVHTASLTVGASGRPASRGVKSRAAGGRRRFASSRPGARRR